MEDQILLWKRIMNVDNQSSDSKEQLKKEICRIGKEIDKSGLALFLGVYAPGNLSARLPKSDRIFVSPSGLPKGELKPSDLVIVNLRGEKIGGRLTQSIETPMHCAIYRKRHEVNGILHVHSPMSMAYAVTNREIPTTTIELAGVCGGCVPVARYATAATEELGDVTAETLGFGNAVLLQNHGLVAVGKNLSEAFNTALSVEYTAMVNIYGKILGDLVEIPPDEVRAIRQYILKQYGQKK